MKPVTQLNANELLAWSTSFALASALKEGLRNDVIAMLTEEERIQLFDGYILKTEYDELKAKLWVAQVSSSIQGS
jgi:hypothetical protein